MSSSPAQAAGLDSQPRPLRIVLVSPDPQRRAALADVCSTAIPHALCLERHNLHQVLFTDCLEAAALIVVDAGVSVRSDLGPFDSVRRRAPAGHFLVVDDDLQPLQRSLCRLQGLTSGDQE